LHFNDLIIEDENRKQYKQDTRHKTKEKEDKAHLLFLALAICAESPSQKTAPLHGASIPVSFLRNVHFANGIGKGERRIENSQIATQRFSPNQNKQQL
jgi:hypothetical protein